MLCCASKNTKAVHTLVLVNTHSVFLSGQAGLLSFVFTVFVGQNYLIRLP